MKISPPLKQLLVLSLAATVPVAAGLAIHFDHAATAQRCEAAAIVPPVMAAPATVVPRVVTPVPSSAAELVADADPAFTYGEEFAFVTTIADLEGTFLVVAPQIDESWVDGEITNLSRLCATAPLDRDSVPSDLLAVEGERFDLYDASGRVASGVAGPLQLISDVGGDASLFLDPEEIEGLEAHGDWGDFELPPEVIWDEGRLLLVARIGADAEFATWARHADLEPPDVLRLDEEFIGSPLKPLAEARLRGRPEAQEIVVAWREFVDADSAPKVSVEQWIDDDGEVALATAYYPAASDYGCGSFYAPHWSAVSSERDLPFDEGEHDGGPTAIFDVDGDGLYDALFAPTTASEPWVLLKQVDGGWDEIAAVSEIPSDDCQC